MRSNRLLPLLAAVFDPCPDVDPALQPVGAPGQVAACHLHGVVGRPVEREDAVAAE